MAIVDAIPGLKVSIVVDGQALQEYDDDEAPEGGRTTCKYIESSSDKEFLVRYEFSEPYTMIDDAIQVDLIIDGKRTTGRLICRHALQTHFKNKRLAHPFGFEIDGVRKPMPGDTSYEYLHKFRFSQLAIATNDETLTRLEKDLDRIKEAGEIVFHVYRSASGLTTKKVPIRDVAQTHDTSAVHEKALKGQALSHQFSLAPPQRASALGKTIAARLDETPLATFKFKYRSKDALKSLLVLPRTPSPEPDQMSGSPSPVDINNLDADQRKKLGDFLRGLNGDRSSKTPSRTIKRERVDDVQVVTSKKRKAGPNVTIDLTEDSDEENIVPLN